MKRFLLAGALVIACSSKGAASGETITSGDGPGDPGPGGVRFTASGEVLALTGYPFPPASDSDPVFVDGWEVHFTRLLVTIGNVTLSENPDLSPGDQSRTGAVVARLDGPWAIDLAHADASNLPGKGDTPGEQAIPFESIAKNDALKTEGTRYAFGFDAVAATTSAKQINLDAAAKADYDQMIANGCAVLYVGHASFKGDKSDASCYPPDRQSFPDEVDFRLCFKSPTSYENCQNADNGGAAFPNEESQRGIALLGSSSTIAQITFHTDHPFWDSTLHESPLHFDQFAARASQGTLTLEDTKGVDYTEITDKAGKALQWRYCVDPGSEVHAKFSGTMRFSPQNVPHASGADPASGLRDYYDFSTYDQSTQGHLNADGLCFVKRNYASPP